MKYFSDVVNHYYEYDKTVIGKVAQDEIVPFLQEALRGEYQQWDLYYAYKSVLMGTTRDSIAEHFAEHADDEAKHIELLQRHIVSFGEEPTLERHPIPKLEDMTVTDIIALQLSFEEKAVAFYEKILQVLDDENSALRIDIENVLSQEQEHAHDLVFLLGGKK
jgi:bacterioferritin